MDVKRVMKKRMTPAMLLLCILGLGVFTSCEDPATLIYTVTYDGNGHTEGTVPEGTSAACGTVVTIAGNPGGLEKSGYWFSGWNTAADGTGGSYKEGSTLVIGITDVTLYALWSVDPCMVVFNANGGSGSMNTVTGTEGEIVTLPENTFTRSGYEFYGWSESTKGIITQYDQASYTFNATEIILYARWNSENATGANWFTYTESDVEKTITGYTGSFSEIVIPDIIEDCPVTSIGGSAFANITDLTSVTIPESVVEIGNDAFAYCSGLTSVHIPDSVTSIGTGAFYFCEGLSSITLPDSVTFLGDKVFGYCSGITSLILSESAASIGEYAFSHCAGLTSLIIPDSVTEIGVYAFEYCTALGSLTISNSLTVLSDSAFSFCSNLTVLTLPDSVTTISADAFRYCTELNSVILSDSVTYIGSAAFINCNKLSSITLPASMTSIGGSAFSLCRSLSSVAVNAVIPPALGSDVFIGCTVLSHIYVPVGTVGDYQTAWSAYSSYIAEQP